MRGIESVALPRGELSVAVSLHIADFVECRRLAMRRPVCHYDYLLLALSHHQAHLSFGSTLSLSRHEQLRTAVLTG